MKVLITGSAGFKLILAAQSSWHRFDGQNQLPKVVNGIKFVGGIEVKQKLAAA